MKRILRHILPVILCLPALGGCMKWDYADMEEFAATGPGLFIT
ncbi:YncE family protein, partial [Alistipes onderdonkii]